MIGYLAVDFDARFVIMSGVVIMIASFILLRISRSRSRAPRNSARESLEAIRERSDIQDSLSRLVIDIQDLSRKNIAILDSKIRYLQQLIVDADARIKTLKALQDPAAAPTPDAPPATQLHQKVFDLADRGLDAHKIGRELGLERGEVELIMGLRKMKSDP